MASQSNREKMVIRDVRKLVRDQMKKKNIHKDSFMGGCSTLKGTVIIQHQKLAIRQIMICLMLM